MSHPHLAMRTSRRTRTATVSGLLVLVLTTFAGMGASDVGPSTVRIRGDLSSSAVVEQQQAPEMSPSVEGLNQSVAVADEVLPPTPPGAQVGVAPAPAVPAPPASVVPVSPVIAVRGLDSSAVAAIADIEGVAGAAAAEVGVLPLNTPSGVAEFTVAAVDPEAFRPLTPVATAAEVGVWERLASGDAAFTHDAGNRTASPLGSTVTTVGTAAPLRIGSYASNGVPSVADALVSDATARTLGLQGETTIYVAVEGGTTLESITDAIGTVVPGGTVEVLRPPAEQMAFLEGNESRAFFDPFSYTDHGDGLITIDPGWVAANIETRRLPIFTGNVTCHRQMLVQLEGALAEVQAAGLAPLIDTTDYGGCWVARHIDWRPDRPISMHAWGLAVDFNVRTNQLGAQPTMDPRIVAIFDRWGFVWGGRWSRPDGMHFELGSVVTQATGAVGTLG